MVGSKTVFFMDEISTGLDSSTTYAIVKFLRDQTHALNYTTMISLLQPAPESYDLFDDILLLAEGMLCFAAKLPPARIICLGSVLAVTAHQVCLRSKSQTKKHPEQCRFCRSHTYLKLLQ